MSDVSLPMKLKEFEARIAKLESAKPAEIQPEGPLEARVRDLENKYRMLNARIARKQ